LVLVDIVCKYTIAIYGGVDNGIIGD